MKVIAVLVHLLREIGPFFPALQLGAIVECNRHELRRTLDFSLCGPPAAAESHRAKDVSGEIFQGLFPRIAGTFDLTSADRVPVGFTNRSTQNPDKTPPLTPIPLPSPPPIPHSVPPPAPH